MKITVVYESMFGNTHQVAQAISDGVREAQPDADVECVSVGDASTELIKSTNLLVVGGPTHIRGITSGFSRKMGIKGEQKDKAGGEPAHELEEDAEGPGVREWFNGLPKVEDGGQAAAFDTRLGSSMAGGAARGIARRLRKHGYHLVSDPEGFVVPIGRISTRAVIAASSDRAVSSARSGFRQEPQLGWSPRRIRTAFWRSECPGLHRRGCFSPHPDPTHLTAVARFCQGSAGLRALSW